MEPTTINKKNVFYWSLYDFAKEIVVFVFALYFSEWLVVDNKVGDIWYNLIFVGSSVLLLLTAPVLAIIADKQGKSLPYLRLMAGMLFISTLAADLFAVLRGGHPNFVLLAALGFLFSNYFYQFSLVFYNSFLKQLAPAGRQGMVSGIGYASSWLGGMAGVLVGLPFATGTLYLFGDHGRAQTFLPATILFALLALPMLLLFKDSAEPTQVRAGYWDEFKNLVRSFTELCRAPGVGRFLLAFFFYNDAILTLENNFAIYLQQVFHVSDKIKSLVLLAGLITTIAGALIGGWLGDKIGLKKCLLAILAVLILALPVLGLSGNFYVVVGVIMLIGFFYGGSWVVARAILSYLAPKGHLNHSFSYYSIFERFATFVGPLTWGLIVTLLHGHGVLGYRTAAAAMGVFVLFGLLVIRKIPSDKSSTTFP